MSFIVNVSGFKPIMGELERLQLYRWPHDLERVENTENKIYLGNGNWTGKPREVVIQMGEPLPEVFRLGPDHQTPLSDGYIRLWRAMNPMLSDDKFATLLGNTLWLTNNTGWPGRRNIIQGEDLDEPLPAFHAPVVTGGALFAGIERDGHLEIENLRSTAPAPGVEYVLARSWLWFWGTSVLPDGRVNTIKRLGTDGNMHPVKVPFISRYPLVIPLGWLQKLRPGYVPNSLENVISFATKTGDVTGRL